MYALHNVRLDAVFEIPQPWGVWKDFPIPKEVATKDQFEAWRTDATTKHAFISGVAGFDPRQRINSGRGREEDSNPPSTMMAYIADYDVALSDEKLGVLLKEPPVPIMPNFVVKSFSQEGDSGRYKRRLVWLFEVPIRLCGTAHAKAFFKVLTDRLKAKKWLAGFDDDANKPQQYFEIGRDWVRLAKEPVHKSLLYAWAAEAASSATIFEGRERPAVDLALIAQAVADKFPGRWQGDFARGAQGVRFWDPAADNERAALVADRGMVCFTGGKPFVSWEEIFGSTFVDELRGDRWGEILSKFFWDGKHVWRQDAATKCWIPETLDNVRRIWNVRYKISSAKSKGGGSDLDEVEVAVRETRFIFGALPFVHMPPGEIIYEKKRFLNTADACVLEPMKEVDTRTPYEFDVFGKAYFPWNHSFLRNLFEPVKRRPHGVPDSAPLEDIQLFIFLAWLKRCYEGGYYHNPLVKQGIVLAGPVGVGKTFLVDGIMVSLLGPSANGTSYLVEGKDFNSQVAERPICFVDDATPASNPEYHKRFSAIFKRMQANPVMRYNKKYGSDGQVEWRGCTVLACNLDPESLRSLPSLDHSNLEKISMFLTKRGVVLPGETAQKKFLDAEMRAFALFLLKWVPPEWTLAPLTYRGRYGVRSFQHDMLRESASSTGTPSTVLDVLQELYEDWARGDTEAEQALSGAQNVSAAVKKAWVWEGRASRLYRNLAAYAPGIIGKLSHHQVALALGVLSSKGFGITKLEGGKWHIVFDEVLLKAFDPAANTEY